MKKFFAPCPRGLEDLLVAELKDVNASHVVATAGGVSFSGNVETCYRANLHSAIATRVLWNLAEGDYANEEDIYKLALDVAWSKLFAATRTIRVHVTSVHSPLKSIEFATLRVKDAVCDRFRMDTGARPNVDTKDPDIRIHLFLTNQKATIYLDTSGEPLWMRGHKIAKVVAPLKENLAAGILHLIGWKPGIALVDPMCGSGTFLLEAARMSLGDAPGLSREKFAFERFVTFDRALWKKLRMEAAASRIASDAPLPIYGFDNEHDAIMRARQNLAHAGIDDLVQVEQKDILELVAPVQEGIMIANPPYGERLGDAKTMADFYPHLGDALKKNFAGWNCWFLSADKELPKQIRLAVKRRIPIFNGNLECRIYGFPIIAGSARSQNF